MRKILTGTGFNTKSHRRVMAIQSHSFVNFTSGGKPVYDLTLIGKVSKILFLDIDGVINTPSTYFNMREMSTRLNKNKQYSIHELVDADIQHEPYLCNNYEPHLIQRLQTIIDAVPQLYICICSSNRYNMSNTRLKQMLDNYGLTNYKLLSATPVLNTKYLYKSDIYQHILSEPINITSLTQPKYKLPEVKVRGHEVKYILDLYKPTHYVILDDMSNYPLTQQSNFIKVNGAEGISQQDVYRAISILKGNL